MPNDACSPEPSSPGPASPPVERGAGPAGSSRPCKSVAVLSPVEAQLRGGALLLPIAICALSPYILMWGLPEVPFPTSVAGALAFSAAFVLGVIFHELLHGLGHALGRATWSEVNFGMHWGALTPYAECRVPCPAFSYRLTLLLPGLLLGALPVAIGTLFEEWLVVFFGFLMLVAAAGDLVILSLLAGVPGDAWVQDHPSRVGCVLIGGPDQDPPPPVSSEADQAPAQSPPLWAGFLFLVGLLSSGGTSVLLLHLLT